MSDQPAVPSDPLDVTLERFAAVVACSLPTARAYLRDGCPSRGRQGRALVIPLGEAVPWVLERQKARLAPQRRPLESALDRERTKLAKVQRQLATLKVKELAGDLVNAADAERALRGFVAAIKTQVLAVPRRAVLAGLPREHEGLVKQLVVDALRDLAALTTFRDLYAAGRSGDES